MNTLEELKHKLKAYRKKYYQNQMIKGALYALGLGLILVLLVSVLEHVGRFSSSWRLGILIASCLVLLYLLVSYLIYPMLQWAGIGKVLTDEQAAKVLARHFPHVDDKIIGALQLGKTSGADNALVSAAVQQRVDELRPLPFAQSINYRDNLKYAPLALAPLLVFAVLILSEGGKEVLQGTTRVIRYTENFKEPAPFRFVVLNDSLAVRQGDELRLKLGLQGEEIPNEAQVEMNGQRLRMIKEAPGRFNLDLKGLENNVTLAFVAGAFSSKNYEVTVIPVPRVKSVSMEIIPPAYTNLAPSTVAHKPNLEVPVGSEIIWNVRATKQSAAILETNAQSQVFKEGILAKRLMQSLKYRLFLQNEFIKEPIVAPSQVRVKPDEYPSVMVNWEKDSSAGNFLVYDLAVGDDYGISRIIQNIKMGEQVVQRMMPVRPRQGGVLNLDTFRVEEGTQLEVFFTVYDNDGVQGPKKSISQSYRERLLSEPERDSQQLEKLRSLSKAAQAQQKEWEAFNDELKQLERSLRSQKQLQWKDKNKLKELLKELEALQEKERKRKEKQKELLKKDPKLDSTKKERLNELSKEEKQLEKIKKEIEKLLEKLDKEALQEKLKQLQEENKRSARKEERNQKTLEDLVFQRDLLKKADELDRLSKKLEQLSKKDEKNELAQMQDAERQLEDIAKELEDLGEKNKELEQTLDSDQFKKSLEQTENELQKARQNQSSGKPQQSNESQKKSSEGAKEMSDLLMQSMMQMMSKQLELNMKSLRQILENLETYSEEVEVSADIIEDLSQGDPRYRAMLKEQNRLSEGSQVIRDSLTFLAEKAPEVKDLVFDELYKMEQNLNQAKELLQEQDKGRAAAKHQYSMMAANELALMLEQSLSQMQQMMAQQKKGNQNCQKPGGAKPKPGSTGMKMQQMGQKVEKLKKGSKKGKGKGMNGKELVQILAEQEQLRKELKELSEKVGGENGNGNLKKALEELDKIEEDLLNQRLDDNFVERYKRVETRLLESEKAEQQRKTNDQRESKAASELQQIERKALERYLKEKGITKEQLLKDNIRLAEFYQMIAEKQASD